MKPAPFSWHGPRSVAETVALLAEFGSEAKVLAGGQSLIPVLAMRLAEPANIIDINEIAELDTVVSTPAGVTVGALARHSRVEHDAEAAVTQPLLRQALRLVAHPTIRNRGTTVGSLAHADPGRGDDGGSGIVRRHGDGRVRVGPARDHRSRLLPRTVGVRVAAGRTRNAGVLPRVPGRRGDGVRRDRPQARRLRPLRGCGHRGTGSETGRCDGSACAYLSVGDTPLVVDLTGAWQTGEGDAAEQARAAVDPQSDLHATADYRRHLAGVLTIRAARQAISAAERREGAA